MTIAEQWADYEAACVPPELPPAVRRTLRCVFYRGAAAFAFAMCSHTVETGEARHTSALFAELRMFMTEREAAALPQCGAAVI